MNEWYCHNFEWQMIIILIILHDTLKNINCYFYQCHEFIRDLCFNKTDLLAFSQVLSFFTPTWLRGFYFFSLRILFFLSWHLFSNFMFKIYSKLKRKQISDWRIFLHKKIRWRKTILYNHVISGNRSHMLKIKYTKMHA